MHHPHHPVISSLPTVPLCSNHYSLQGDLYARFWLRNRHLQHHTDAVSPGLFTRSGQFADTDRLQRGEGRQRDDHPRRVGGDEQGGRGRARSGDRGHPQGQRWSHFHLRGQQPRRQHRRLSHAQQARPGARGQSRDDRAAQVHEGRSRGDPWPLPYHRRRPRYPHRHAGSSRAAPA